MRLSHARFRSAFIYVCLFMGGVVFFFTTAAAAGTHRMIIDAAGRKISVPTTVNHIICSGAGCLRLITYLDAQDKIVAVDDMEKRRNRFDARPYALANPWFKSMPIFGEFRGHDNLEVIMGLTPRPQVIFKTFGGSGTSPVELQQKTGIPVVVLKYKDLARGRSDFFQALEIAGTVLDKNRRAREVIDFFTSHITRLERRTRDIPKKEIQTTYVGGIAFKGPHGFQSTEPGYPPFQFINTRNVAAVSPSGRIPRQSNVSKENLLMWNPKTVFLDLSTLQLGNGDGGLGELKSDPVYRALSAINTGAVFGVLPYNWYSMNQGSILANAWFIGKCLYPDQFKDVDPEAMADEIYTFLMGEPVFEQMDERFRNLVFKELSHAL